MTATNKGLKIIYEDNHLLVVLKEANILSQKDKTDDEDLLSILKKYLKDKHQKPGKAFLGLVQRLDRRVGGLIVYAKTSKAASRLSAQIREHKFQKDYIALVVGEIKETQGRLKNHLRKVERGGKRFAEISSSNKAGAKEAILEYRLLKTVRIDNLCYSLLAINLVTGRYNQIRAQLAAFGHPIVNDFKYNYQGKNYQDELALFCWRIKFQHPTKLEMLEFEYFPSEGVWEYIKEEEN
jgi:23S rRNA pseudouridine1911/1915/1917 synthase